MAGVVNPITKVYINGVDYSKNVNSWSINRVLSAITPSWQLSLSKYVNITGGETVDIYAGYGSTYVPLITGGTISTFNRGIADNGVSFNINGRGPISKLIDESPAKDRIYVPTWDKRGEDIDGVWAATSCGKQRVEPIPLGIDPNQDVDTYEVFKRDWTLHHLIKDIAKEVNMTAVINIPDYKYRDVFKITRSQTYFSGLQQLIGVWSPFVFVRGTTIYILDTDTAMPESSNMTYGGDSCIVLNHQYSRNNITNRLIIKGGYDESIKAPDTKKHWHPKIDVVQEFITSNGLETFCDEVIVEQPTPDSLTGSFTGTIKTIGYFKPMFGEQLKVYEVSNEYGRGRHLKTSAELYYYRAQGNYGPQQTVCTSQFGYRRQVWIPRSFHYNDSLGTVDLPPINTGYRGQNISATGAEDSTTSLGIIWHLSTADWMKVIDEECVYDTGNRESTLTSYAKRTYGVCMLEVKDANNYIMSSPVTSCHQIYDLETQKTAVTHQWQYRILTEEVVVIDVGSATSATKSVSTFDYTHMTNDYDTPIIYNTAESVPLNNSNFIPAKEKILYQYEKYFEDTASIAEFGRRPIVTIYDPSIIDNKHAQKLANKIFARSGKLERELTIDTLIGNPIIDIGKTVKIETSTYKQLAADEQSFATVNISGGDFLISSIDHTWGNSEGYKMALKLSKLWKLV